MTEKDRQEFKSIIKEAVDGLKELFIEKLNGHGQTVERHSGQINQLYDLDRARVADIAILNRELTRVDGRIDGLSAVTRVEEDARDKRETAVETVKDKAISKTQFSTATWVSIGLAVVSTGVAIWAILK